MQSIFTALSLKFLGACHGQSMLVTAGKIKRLHFKIEECFPIDEILLFVGGLGLKIYDSHFPLKILRLFAQ